LSRAYCCEVCDDADLAQVAVGLQRDHEVTELVVSDARKAREWAGVSRALNAIADGG
jgi:hypothetical protein